MSVIFHQAVSEGDTTKVKFILKYGQGIRVNQPNKYGLTALQQACVDGNLSLANFLLERGADLKILDSEGRSALHLASEQGHLDIVSLLVNSACADVNARNSNGQKAVDVAQNEQVRALLSQAMLSESFKQRCSLAQGCDESCGFKNVPGWRYSISSTSTDSGVSEDSTISHDSGLDSRYPSRYYKTASHNDEQISDYYVSDPSRDQRLNGTGELIYARRVETVTPNATVTKSHSFTGTRHEYSVKLENAEQDAENTGYASQARYPRRQQRNRRDPTRRKTVTFGENESYFISPREELRYPKSYSLTRPPISSSSRYPLPESWGALSTPHEPNSSQFSEQQEATATNSKDEDLGSAKKQENIPRKERKFKKHILPGFLEKYVH